MSRVKIYLRSIKLKERNFLALFDSNRDGAINDLVTVVRSGDKIIWKPDRRSGIKCITNVYPKEKEGKIFLEKPKKRFLARGFYLIAPEVSKEAEQAYNIDYRTCDDTEVSIDPFIRVIPPDQ